MYKFSPTSLKSTLPCSFQRVCIEDLKASHFTIFSATMYPRRHSHSCFPNSLAPSALNINPFLSSSVSLNFFHFSNRSSSIFSTTLEDFPARARLFLLYARHQKTLVFIRKKIVDDYLCPICKLHPKSLAHVLWECAATKDVQAQKRKKRKKKLSTIGSSFLNSLSLLTTRLEMSKLSLVVVT